MQTKKTYGAPRLTTHGSAVAQTQGSPIANWGEFIGYRASWWGGGGGGGPQPV